ncbi:CdvA-like protein [Candidatus Bathyarchaeota archaeon]|nr:CdvA-like protein [Candidatus Bathyarchaeota archaeon]
MISWEYSFEKISKDLELAKKKKQALDDLFGTGKISQFTYDSFNKGLTDTIAEIETHRKALAEKMTSKIAELEQQVNTLEMFLANAEILYAAGEIDDELHTRESNAFTQGLEATKQELEVIKEVVANLMPEKMELTLPPAPGEIVEAPSAEEVLEETPEIPTEVPIEAPVEAQVEVETENISEETEIEQPMEVQAEEASTEETLTEETPNEGFEGIEENASETPTEEQSSPSEEVDEEPVVSPEADAETIVEKTPIEGETEVEVEAEAEDTSSFQDEEEEATAEEQEEEE